MTVFKGHLLIIRRNLVTILMYIGIFIMIAFLIQKSYQSTGLQEGFSSVKMKVAVIDREKGPLAEALRQMMERDQILMELEDDPQILQEELYYSNVEYAVIVPEDAKDRLQKGEAAVRNYSVPGTVAAYYVNAQINHLLNQIRVYLAAGFSIEEACLHALELGNQKAEVELEDVNGNAGIRKDYNYYFAYMPYGFLGACIMAVGLLVMEFKKPEIRRRTQGSAVPFWKQNLAMAGALLLIGVTVWGICILLQSLLYKGGIFQSPHVWLYLLNSILCILTALSLGFFAGTVARGPVAINGLNNVISLGMCFLGGIFVPMDIMGEGVKKAASFLPAYWYSVINGMLGDFEFLSEEMRSSMVKGFLIQLLFAAACLGITLMIRKKQTQES